MIPGRRGGAPVVYLYILSVAAYIIAHRVCVCVCHVTHSTIAIVHPQMRVIGYVAAIGH